MFAQVCKALRGRIIVLVSQCEKREIVIAIVGSFDMVRLGKAFESAQCAVRALRIQNSTTVKFEEDGGRKGSPTLPMAISV